MASDSGTAVSADSVHVGMKLMKLQLYSFFRSSCSWRVRIALNLRGLEYEYKAVNLWKREQFSPGLEYEYKAVNLWKREQFSPELSKLNPLCYVPVLVDGDIVVSDSFAILLYLEEKYPEHPLLPFDLQKKAINFQAANIVWSSMQPFQNDTAVVKHTAFSE